MRPLLALTALTLLAGAAAGHGATNQLVRQFGPFDVTFHGYEYTTPAESIRVAFTVARNATGERVDIAAATLNVTMLDVRGGEVAAFDRDLVQTTVGFAYTDLLTAGRGLIRLRVTLPEGQVASFDQVVCDIDDQGQLACGIAPGGVPALPGVVALLALAAAARGVARRPPPR